MFGECHAHALMNSVNYRAAVELHKEKVNESAVRKCLEAYKEAGVSFVRDGGDPYGVSELAAKLAPEYGIDYRTPIFAIHKNGHYGSIVGRGFADIKEFHQRVLLLKPGWTVWSMGIIWKKKQSLCWQRAVQSGCRRL